MGRRLVRRLDDGVTSPETFTGSAQGAVSEKSCNLTFTTGRGLTCSGRFVYPTTPKASGPSIAAADKAVP
jgi:hypothetical protein